MMSSMRGGVVLAVLACARVAAAQQLVAKGDVLVKQGKADEAKDQYTNARVAYDKAIESGGDASIYLSWSAVDEKLGDVAAAYQHAKQAVDPNAGLKPDVVKKAQAKIDELQPKLAVVTLVVDPEATQTARDRNPA